MGDSPRLDFEAGSADFIDFWTLMWSRFTNQFLEKSQEWEVPKTLMYVEVLTRGELIGKFEK